jgi:hypothetical protein
MTITTYTLTTTSGSKYELEINDRHSLITGHGSAGPILMEAPLHDTALPLIGERYYYPGGLFTSKVVSVTVEGYSA